MGIFDKIKEVFKKNKKENIENTSVKKEQSTEEFAVEMNRETLEIYNGINEIDFY